MSFLTRVRNVAVLLAGGAGALAAQGEFVWQKDLVVEKADAPVTLGIEYIKAVNSSMTLHGDLTILFTNSVTDACYVNAEAPDGTREATPVTIAIGPDAGDDATLCVRKAHLDSVVGNYPYAEVVIGGNGGNGRLNVNYGGGTWDYARARVKSLILSENAQTTDDAFVVATIGTYSDIDVATICNRNAKPMKVLFHNPDSGAYNRKQYSSIMNTYNGKLFSLPVEGGDIVLTGEALAPVTLKGWYGNVYSLFDGTPAANLVFEGPCDVRMEVGHAGNFKINGSNIVWNNTGDLVLCAYSSGTAWTAETSAANWLPFGSQTGLVRVEKVTFDLRGNDQRANGVVVTGGGSVVSTGSAATVSVGDENGDGFLSGVLDDASVTWAKNGTDGVLVLSNATLNALCMTGGVLRLAPNTVNSIGRLAITNAIVEISDTATLDVETWERGPDVHDGFVLTTVGGVSNEVVSAIPTASGATLYKNGAYLLHCVTPADAKGMEVLVSGGTLKMGGEVTDNKYWRMTFKKAMVPVKNYAEPDDGYSKDVNLLLGGIGLFSSDGFHVLPNWMTRAADGTAASALAAGSASSERATYDMSTAIYKGLYPQTARTSDPICGGGSADSGARANLSLNGSDKAKENRWDEIATASNRSWFNWSQGSIFANGALDPDDPTTWERIVWRLPDGAKPCGTYALGRFVNTNTKDCPHPTDWMLESSPDGTAWQTMDERSGQDFTAAINVYFNYTYNNHIPYLFTANRANWHFDRFGPVTVAAGATLDLSEIPSANIAISGLRVDLTAGAGTITRFVPAANGVLYLSGLRPSDCVDGALKAKVELPLAVTEMQETSRLASWSVVVNGKPASGSKVIVKDGKLVVWTRQGSVLIFR